MWMSIWDLAVHDLSIMQHILPDWPTAITATGMTHVSGGVENVAYITAFYPNKLIAHINVNWLSPVKVRRTLIAGTKQMIVYDDVEVSEKIKIYDRGITVTSNPEDTYKILVSYRTGDIHSPKLDAHRGTDSRSASLRRMHRAGQEPRHRWPCRPAGGACPRGRDPFDARPGTAGRIARGDASRQHCLKRNSL